MSPFWQNLELLPSAVREKARKPERTKEEYAEGREKFQEGLRESEDRMKNKEITAEVMLYIEFNEEELKEKMAKEKPEDVVKSLFSYDSKQWGDLSQAFADRHFDLQVEAQDDGTPVISATVTLPEGNVTEKMQLNQSLQEALITRATQAA